MRWVATACNSSNLGDLDKTGTEIKKKLYWPFFTNGYYSGSGRHSQITNLVTVVSVKLCGACRVSLSDSVNVKTQKSETDTDTSYQPSGSVIGFSITFIRGGIHKSSGVPSCDRTPDYLPRLGPNPAKFWTFVDFRTSWVSGIGLFGIRGPHPHTPGMVGREIDGRVIATKNWKNDEANRICRFIDYRDDGLLRVRSIGRSTRSANSYYV